MLKERRGITYLCPQGKKSGTRGCRCSNLRLLSSRTSPDASLAFTHLKPSDLFTASVCFSPSMHRTNVSKCVTDFSFSFWLFWEASAAKTGLPPTLVELVEEVVDSQGKKTRCEAAEAFSHSKRPRQRTLGQTQPFAQTLFSVHDLLAASLWLLLLGLDEGKKKNRSSACN